MNLQHEAITKPTLLGVIGGSGVYQMDGVELVKEHTVETPFGKPSDVIVEGKVGGRTVFFLPRHGRGHRYLPSEVNYRANIHALKQLKVTHVLAVSAVGIMQEHIKPGDMIVPDQIFDRTKGVRASTFFGEGVVGHVGFADPFSTDMRKVIVESAKRSGATVHGGGTYVCMEGPQFSTRAESHFYRSGTNAVVIGMTALPEAKLAREAEMCYGMLALGTDYDCWKENEEAVSVEAVMAVLKANTAMANKIVKEVAASLPKESSAPEFSAAKYAIMTSPDKIPQTTRQRLATLYGHYLS